jgi:hypothetical protein
MSGARKDRELLARLRKERAAIVDSVTEQNRRRRAARKKIRDELRKGPATVPAVAAVVGLPTSEVLWHLAAMRKYGELVEDQKAGDYFTYRLTAPAGSQGTPGSQENEQGADD